MADSPTPDQLKAIAHNEGNCLVSAGAGAGKTKVLTQRISRLVAEKEAKLGELLVLTFTNKAAFEIKDRVRTAIATHPLPEVRAQSPEVEGASITTFDSFALDLVTRYHYRLGIDKEISLVPQSLIDTQKKLTIERILEERAALANQGKDQRLKEFVGRYCVKSTDSVIKLIIAIDKEADLKKDKKAFLKNYVEENFSDAFFENGIKTCYQKAIAIIEKACDLIHSEYENTEYADLDGQLLQGLLSCKTHDDLYSAEIKFVAAKKNALTDQDKSARAKVKEMVALAKSYLVAPKAESHRKHMELKDDADLLFGIVRELNNRLDEWKKANASYSFADIASLARDLVQDDQVAAELRAKYKFAMIDEYQDTSDLQDQLIERINDKCLFMVGDIKQSIYRFRNANPKNFKAKMDAYSLGQGGTLITMAENFRSRKQIIDAVNAIFGKIMSEELGGVDYSKNQALAYGNKGYEETKDMEPYGYRVYRYTRGGKGQAEDEAEAIARDIASKIVSGYKVHDWSKPKGDPEPYRPCDYGDFAILIRKKDDFPIYERKFRDYGIPISIANPKKKDEKTIKIVLKTLLRLALEVKAGLTDSISLRHLYVSLKRSFAQAEKDEAIYASLTSGEYLKDPIFQQIRDVLEKSESIGNLARNLVKSFDLARKLPLIGDVKENFEVIESWISYLESLSKFTWDLQDVIQYYDDLDKTGVEEEDDQAPSESEAVRLMSIHASKGLEFPIVYLPQLNKPISRDKVNFTFSRNWGILLPNQNEAYSVAEGPFHILAQSEEYDESLSEMMRLFYVALTRAKENLVFLLPKPEKQPSLPAFPKSFEHFLLFADAEKGHEFDADTLPEVDKKSLEETALKRKEEEAGREDSENEAKIKEGLLHFLEQDLRRISSLPKEVDAKRASKEVEGPIDQGKLRYGEKLHRLMELTDVCKKDVSWIEDQKLREKIEKVLSLPCFKDSAKARQFHEYSFLGPEGQEGIIDLFLLYEDHVDLIDFKASDIEDLAYASQLRFYAEFLEKSFKRPVSAYLVSISKGRHVRVEL